MDTISRSFSSIEPLEARIAPAAVVMITDIDGDTVSVKTSKGTNAQLTAALKLSGMGMSGTIREIDFSTVPLVGGVNPFAGTDLAISVVKQGPAGNGRVAVGYIDAAATDGVGMDGTGLVLGNVKIAGDLGQIDVGAGGTAVVLKSLTTQTLGAFGTSTQGANASGTSNFNGKVGSIKVTGAVNFVTLSFTSAVANVSVGGAFLESNIAGTGEFAKINIGPGAVTSNFAAKSIKSLVIKGTLYYNVAVTDDIGTLKIGGDLIYGAISAVNMTSITIGGTIYGNDGAAGSGAIAATGNIGSVKIGHNLRGGSADPSGRISAAGNIGSVTIGGSILAPEVARDSLPGYFAATNASTIFAGGNIGTVTVGGNLTGPLLYSINFDDPRAAVNCSTIIATGDIAKVMIKGSMIGTAGDSFQTGSNVRIAATHLGTVSIGGDVTGFIFANLPQIYATGTPDKLAIAKLTIGGSLRYATVLAGLISDGSPTNADGQIGSVIIKGNLASATVATVDAGMGVSDNVNIVSRISSITVGGFITGNAVVRAEHIVSAKLGGIALKLKAGERNDTTAIVFTPATASIAEYM